MDEDVLLHVTVLVISETEGDADDDKRVQTIAGASDGRISVG